MKGKQIMNENEVKQGLKDFICENLGVDADALEFSTPLLEGTEIGLDSIDSIEIIVGLEDLFGVDMSGSGKENFQSIRTLTKYVEEHKED